MAVRFDRCNYGRCRRLRSYLGNALDHLRDEAASVRGGLIASFDNIESRVSSLSTEIYSFKRLKLGLFRFIILMSCDVLVIGHGAIFK